MLTHSSFHQDTYTCQRLNLHATTLQITFACSKPGQPWLNTWDHHDLDLEPFIEFFSCNYTLKILILHGLTHNLKHGFLWANTSTPFPFIIPGHIMFISSDQWSGCQYPMYKSLCSWHRLRPFLRRHGWRDRDCSHPLYLLLWNKISLVMLGTTTLPWQLMVVLIFIGSPQVQYCLDGAWSCIVKEFKICSHHY